VSALRERVGIAEIKVATAPTVLVSYGLGSCLGIALYDAEIKIGALAHTMLPYFRAGIRETRTSKFVDMALQEMIELLQHQGAEPNRLRAKLVGGANMFADAPGTGRSSEGIGSRNIQAAHAILGELGIPLLAEDTGGNNGRTMEFDLENGVVSVLSVRNHDRVIL